MSVEGRRSMVGREGLHQSLSFYLSQTPAAQTPTAFVAGGGPRQNSCIGLALLDSVWPTVIITRGDICQPFSSQYTERKIGHWGRERKMPWAHGSLDFIISSCCSQILQGAPTVCQVWD